MLPLAQLLTSSLHQFVMLVSTSIFCREDFTWRGRLRLDSVIELVISAQDTEVPEDQVVSVGCEPVLDRLKKPKFKSEV